jgi:transcriptional regulator with XRE-family HTH domain
MLEPSFVCNGSKLKALRNAKRWSQECLADKANCSKRTVENAEAGKRITESRLKRIAEALGVPLAELVASVPEVQLDSLVPGSLECYLEAIPGIWRAEIGQFPGADAQGSTVKALKLEYELVFSRQGRELAGSCRCLSHGYEHERFALKGTVQGPGFVMVDGYRDVHDGAIHFFRSIVQFSSNGKEKKLEGGYVVYDLGPQAIFVGRVTATPSNDRKMRSRRRRGRGQ